MDKPDIVSRTEWQRQRDELLIAEKAATRALDALAAQRRRLPMERVEQQYTFDTADGPRSLVDLFAGREELALYQFMDNGPGQFCPGCTQFTDNVPPAALARLAERGVSWITVSNMPRAQFEPYAASRGWTVPFASSRGTSWDADWGTGYFHFSTFLRDGEDVYRTYQTAARGVEPMLFHYAVLDRTVYGRQEDWEDSPSGWPQHPTYG